MKIRFRISAIAVALAMSFVSLGMVGEASSLEEVRSLVESNYYRAVGDEVLAKDSIEGIIEGLGDPHTSYMTKDQYQVFLDSIESKYYGVGFYFEIVEEGVLVSSVIENSPAEAAGIEPGDIVVSADGKSLAGLSSEEVATIIRGPEGSAVTLGILRRGTRIDINAVRGKIQMEYVSEGGHGEGSGYIRISSFGAETGRKFGELLAKQNSDTLVVDIRNNGGGYLNSAIDMLGYLIPKKAALVLKNRNSSNTYYAPDQGYYTDKKLILLLNEYSASASEIVAGALKDQDRALLIGSKSYGKGTAQNFFNVSDGGVLKMTTMEFFSPLGNTINGVGVSPDLEIEEGNVLKVSELLSQGESRSHELEIAGENYKVDLNMARSKDYWGAYKELLDSLYGDKVWSGFYPEYMLVGELKDAPLEKIYTVKFSKGVKPETLNSDTVDFIDADTGQEVELDIYSEGDRVLKVKPLEPLEPKSEYWLKINTGVMGLDGNRLKVGSLATIETGDD